MRAGVTNLRSGLHFFAILALGAVFAQSTRADTIVQTTNLTRDIRSAEWILIAEVTETKKIGSQDFEQKLKVESILKGDPNSLELKLCTAEGMLPGDVVLLAMRSGIQKIGGCEGGIYHSPESGPLVLLPVAGRSGPVDEPQVMVSDDEARFLGCRVEATIVQSGKGNTLNWPPSHYRRRTLAFPLPEFEACIGVGKGPGGN